MNNDRARRKIREKNTLTLQIKYQQQEAKSKLGRRRAVKQAFVKNMYVCVYKSGCQ